MKIVYSVLMMIVFLPVAFQQAVIIVHFKLNQQAIEQKLCVNRGKPQLQCRGTCHLKKELRAAANTDKAWAGIDKNIDMALPVIPGFDVRNLGAPRVKDMPGYIEARYTTPCIEIFVPPPLY